MGCAAPSLVFLSCKLSINADGTTAGTFKYEILKYFAWGSTIKSKRVTNEDFSRYLPNYSIVWTIEKNQWGLMCNNNWNFCVTSCSIWYITIRSNSIRHSPESWTWMLGFENKMDVSKLWIAILVYFIGSLVHAIIIIRVPVTCKWIVVNVVLVTIYCTFSWI